jgi:hypothetical protein
MEYETVRKTLMLATAVVFSSIVYADMAPVTIPITTSDLIISTALTVLVEVLVSLAYLRYKGVSKKKKILITVALANILSVPLLWLSIQLAIPALLVCLPALIVLEIFVVLGESALIHLINRKKLDFRDALIMCFLSNAASFFIWLLIVFIRNYLYSLPLVEQLKQQMNASI